MLNSFHRIEDLEDFEEFVRQGIDKIASLTAEEQDRRDEEDEFTDSVKTLSQRSKKNQNNQIEDMDKISTETYMKMKDILESIKTWKDYLKTGMLTDDVYSTSADDYLGKSLRPKREEVDYPLDDATRSAIALKNSIGDDF
jgi:hypothetical protein